MSTLVGTVPLMGGTCLLPIIGSVWNMSGMMRVFWWPNPFGDTFPWYDEKKGRKKLPAFIILNFPFLELQGVSQRYIGVDPIDEHGAVDASIKQIGVYILFGPTVGQIQTTGTEIITDTR